MGKTYTITCTATDNDGATSTETFSLVVRKNQPTEKVPSATIANINIDIQTQTSQSSANTLGNYCSDPDYGDEINYEILYDGLDVENSSNDLYDIVFIDPATNKIKVTDDIPGPSS